MQALMFLAYLPVPNFMSKHIGTKTRIEGTSGTLSAVLPKIQDLEGSSYWGSKRTLNI